MRVVVVGATGNVGTSLIGALSGDRSVDSILGVARRRPALELPKVEWGEADIVAGELVPLFRGADVVVHLAWLIQPSHDLNALWLTNVEGSRRVFRAAADASVPGLVVASSVGVYSRGPKDRAVDESWPRDGIPSSFYARHKAEQERLLDALEHEHPQLRVVRIRPGLVFKREAASEIRRFFIGPLLPSPLVRPALVRLVPDLPRMRFQAVHGDDLAEAYRLAVVGDARGAFNVAAEPVLDARTISEALGARPLRLPAQAARVGMSLSWRLRLQPTPPGWLDLALGVPIMDVTRAREQLGWTPRRSSIEALRELVEGLCERAGAATPPLARDAGGPARSREIGSGVGGR